MPLLKSSQRHVRQLNVEVHSLVCHLDKYVIFLVIRHMRIRNDILVDVITLPNCGHIQFRYLMKFQLNLEPTHNQLRLPLAESFLRKNCCRRRPKRKRRIGYCNVYGLPTSRHMLIGTYPGTDNYKMCSPNLLDRPIMKQESDANTLPLAHRSRLTLSAQTN